ncbi:Hypothetical predicted protein, partial [Mytilus galloprovincialis]
MRDVSSKIILFNPTVDIMFLSGIRRCPPWDDFIYHKPLHLCYNINGPIRTDFDVLKLKCRSFGAELIRVDSEEKQQYIVQAT